MKKIKEIPSEKYSDIEFIYNFLQYNKYIGNESLPEDNLFHCFWKGKLIQPHLVCLNSILNTQPNAKVIVWTPNKKEFIDSLYFKEFPTEIEIKELTYDIFKKANASELNKKLLWAKYSFLLNSYYGNLSDYNHQVAYASDIFRFFILSIYGGVYFDLDVLFIKDLRNIRLNRFVYKWGVQEYGNGAVMRLEKGHDLIDTIVNNPFINRPFYPVDTFDSKNNLDIWMLPTEFFDIIWKYQKYTGNKLKLPIKTFDDFFNIEITKGFLNHCYAYHWHNRWNKKISYYF